MYFYQCCHAKLKQDIHYGNIYIILSLSCDYYGFKIFNQCFQYGMQYWSLLYRIQFSWGSRRKVIPSYSAPNTTLLNASRMNKAPAPAPAPQKNQTPLRLQNISKENIFPFSKTFFPEINNQIEIFNDANKSPIKPLPKWQMELPVSVEYPHTKALYRQAAKLSRGHKKTPP